MALNKKHIISWTLFDFANSSYSAVIIAVVFPVYYANVIVGNDAGIGDLWWGRAISVSMAVVALSSPFLGGISDYGGLRKKFLFLYTALSVSAIASLFILEKGMVVEGFMLIVAANIGMEGGLVFYNSFLPRIAPREYQGRVSAWGFMVGYAGSILSLLIAIPLVKAGQFKVTWVMVAFFFAIFSLPAFLFLPKDRKGDFTLVHAGVRGIKYTLATLKEIWERREPGKFLFSYLIFEDGVNTVIVFSSIFAATTLGFKPQELDCPLSYCSGYCPFWAPLLWRNQLIPGDRKRLLSCHSSCGHLLQFLPSLFRQKPISGCLLHWLDLDLGQSRQVHGPFIPSLSRKEGKPNILAFILWLVNHLLFSGHWSLGIYRQHLAVKGLLYFQ